MKGTKEQKGITLVALIITIVVLMILAGVAISSIQENGILGYAQNGATTWNKAQENEAGILAGYEEYLANQGNKKECTHEYECGGDYFHNLHTCKICGLVKYGSETILEHESIDNEKHIFYVICIYCDEKLSDTTEDHNLNDALVCSECGHQHSHVWTYEHTNGWCTICNTQCDHPSLGTSYGSHGNGTHNKTYTCAVCGAFRGDGPEDCTYGADGKCIYCGGPEK